MPNNILLIALDDINTWATFKANYGGTIHTPNLDALMARGTVFDNAYCQTALCGPSRSSLLTGQTPKDTGILDHALGVEWYNNLPLSQTIHSLMRDGGYHTAISGKVYHTPGLPPDVRSALFDDYFLSTLNWHTTTSDPFSAGPGPYAATEHGDYINGSWVSNFLRTYSGQEPFFMSWGLFRPHMPWTAPQEFFDLYPLESIVLPTFLEGDLSDVPDFMKNTMDQGYHANVLSQNYWKEMVRAYLACISFADAMVGRVLQALTESGHDDDTTIILFGDNGYHLGDKNIWHKLTLWEESNRVPLIIVDPNGPQGQHITKPVELVDIYSTILDYAGIAQPSWADGNSLRALVQGQPQQDQTDGVAVTFLYGSLAVVAEVEGVHWRYIRYGEGSEELYNLDADPHQWTNLAADPLAAAAKQAMRAHLDAYAAENSIYFSTADGQTVTGSSGKDFLIGGHTVTLSGGDGDDIYSITKIGATISETATGGTDWVYSDVNFTMPDFVENGAITGRGGTRTLHGNNLGNKLYGDLPVDVIYGGGGNDWIESRGNADSVYGEDGNDTLNGGEGNNYIDGGSGDDSILGGINRDRIYDGTGRDTITLGLDVDTVYLTPDDNALDLITDCNGLEGDKVNLQSFGTLSSLTFINQILTVNGEQAAEIRGNFDPSRDLVAQFAGQSWSGTAGDDSQTGTAAADLLLGQGGNDTISGEGGTDIIAGGAGNDRILDGTGLDWMAGGGGADTFVLTPGDGSVDVIADFSSADGDRIDITAFGPGPAVSFAGGILTINGEQVAQVIGSFDPGAHLIVQSGTGETWTGSPGADAKVGTGYGDNLSGLDGNDTIDGDGGNDTISGNDGDDRLSGGSGDDSISGGTGADRLADGSGLDTLDGGADADVFALTAGDNALDLVAFFTGAAGDRIDITGFGAVTSAYFSGGVLIVNGEQVAEIQGDFVIERDLIGSSGAWTGTPSNDSLIATPFNDTLDGKAGNDILWGRAGHDKLTGSNGNDSLMGETGNDTLLGSAGNDTLSDGAGADSLYGGTEADIHLLAAGDNAIDAIWSFEGTEGDRVDLSAFNGISSLSFAGGLLTVNGEAVATIAGNFDVSRDIIGAGLDWTGTDGSESQAGSIYADSLRGLGGDDTLSGGDGNDSLTGGDGNDSLDGGAGNDSLAGDGGADQISDGAGLDQMAGGADADTFILTPGDSAVDIIIDFDGAAGDRIDLTAFGVNPALAFDGGVLTVNGEAVAQIIGDFDVVRDVLALGIDWTGTTGNDTFTASPFADTLRGAGGEDSLSGEDGNDSLDGGGNNDTLTGGAGDDTLIGGGSNDRLIDGTGLDSLSGGLGADYFVLTPNDGALDIIADFAGTAGDRIDITAFGNDPLIEFTGGILSINGEAVAAITGDFDPARHIYRAGIGAGEIWFGNFEDEFHTGSAFNDSLNGGDGNDTIDGSGGDDTVAGEAGDDRLLDGEGSDALSGGSGADTFVLTAGDGSIDTIADFSSAEGDVVDLSAFGPAPGLSFADGILTINGEQVAQIEGDFDLTRDIIAQGETWSGTPLDDVHGGSGFDDVLQGLEGNDSLDGSLGDDTLDGDEGEDTLDGGDGNDLLIGGLGDDHLIDSAGLDSFYGEEDGDTFVLAPGDNEIDIINDFDGSQGDRIDLTAFGQDPVVVFENGVLIVNGEQVAEVRGNFEPSTDLIVNGYLGETWDGTSGDDSHTGTIFTDALRGLEGNDTIDGGSGSDTVAGGDGEDVLNGGSGDDWILGEGDADTVTDGQGLDTLSGGAAADTFVLAAGDGALDVISDFDGTAGDRIDLTGFQPLTDVSFAGGVLTVNGEQVAQITGDFVLERDVLGLGIAWLGTPDADSFTGGAFNDSLAGLDGNDSLAGGDGHDSIDGGGDNDSLSGDAGDDQLFGGDGADVLQDGQGLDSLSGGAAADTFVLAAGDGALDVISDFDGTAGDRIDLTGFQPLADVSFAGGVLTVNGEQVAQITGNFVLERDLIGTGETWTGTPGPDNHTGTIFNDSLAGLDGNDSLAGGDGHDSIDGGGDNDSLSGDAGDDQLFGGDGADVLQDGQGLDTLSGGAAADRFVLAAGDGALDVISDFDGTAGDRIDLTGFGAISSISATGGLLTVNGEQVAQITGNFVLERDLIGTGETWTGTPGPDNHTGTIFNDSIVGGSGNDTLSSGDGNDTIHGYAGNDVINGGNGDDTLISNSGFDTIYDGAGRDSLYGGGEPEADRFVLTPGDAAVDAIWDFSGSSGDKIDLTLFAAGATATFAGGILTVNGEQVVQIQGDFVLSRDVILTPPPPGVGENWTGTAGADTRVGTAYNDSLSGLGGNDTLDGSGGNDTIKGANGDDVIRGGDGNDYLSGNAGADSIFDGAGRDSLYGGTQGDRFVLTAGDNSLDSVYDFKGTEGDRIDLSLFANKTGIAYTGGVLWVNGEAVAEVFGTFDPALHLIL